MSETPSKRRRKGRNAYYRGGNPDYHCPYKTGFMWEAKAADWMAGWKEAEASDRTDEDDASEDACAELESLEDQYQQIARALGCTSYFHSDVLARAEELANFARLA